MKPFDVTTPRLDSKSGDGLYASDPDCKYREAFGVVDCLDDAFDLCLSPRPITEKDDWSTEDWGEYEAQGRKYYYWIRLSSKRVSVGSHMMTMDASAGPYSDSPTITLTSLDQPKSHGHRKAYSMCWGFEEWLDDQLTEAYFNFGEVDDMGYRNGRRTVYVTVYMEPIE